jgi:DNA processing protein
MSVSDEDDLHWLALCLVSGLGPRRAGLLIERLRTPQAIFRASLTELEVCGISGALARSIASGCAFEEAAGQQQKMKECGAAMIPITDPRYPELLRQIFDPPIVLFARGNVNLLRSAAFAMVGTRRPTPYGLAVSERLSGDLARAGLTIVSGMARGIDSASHRGTLAAGGNTIAVLGCGVDIVYPSENKKLAAEIVEKGLIISEFPMGSVAFPQNFPIRNRVIAGISVGLLVVEGAQYSGSAITAKLALDQGKDIFAIPGNITSKPSWGPNLLIKQGAKLVQDWNDIVVDLPATIRRKLIEEGKQRIENKGLDLGTGTPDESCDDRPASLLTGPEGELGRKLLRVLKTDSATHLDNLIENMENCSSSELIAALFELEMLGLAKQLPGKNFVRVW